MIALRGATTIKKDTPEEIKKAVEELLCELKLRNNLLDEDIVFILFSSTSDIRTYYPAKAAREAGYFGIPLFSALEPEIEGSMKLCIRVLMLVKSESSPHHVYLRGAKALRTDISENYNIAIDGPAGSGKSTVSKILGKKLNILCLDTGAMYRACALKCYRQGVNTDDEQAVAEVMKNLKLEVKYVNGVQKTLLDGEDVSGKIRRPEISMLASKVSAIGCVRQKMVALQREIAANTSCIMDGRDIGTNVLPDAKYKFFLTASPEVRAQRRCEENNAKGFNVPYSEILADLIKRDEQDKTRKIAPLVQAEDAVLVDSSDKTIEEVVAFIAQKIQEKV